MLLRISVFIGLGLSLFILPWWATLVFTLAALIYFPAYYEAVIIAFWFEAALGLGGMPPLFVRFGWTVLCLIIVIVASEVRRRIMLG